MLDDWQDQSSETILKVDSQRRVPVKCQMKRETKYTETERNEMKRIAKFTETKRNGTKRNEA